MEISELNQLPIGYGGANLGNLYTKISDSEAKNLVNTAWEKGIRYFDTAPFYGYGLSEHRLGYILREYKQESYVLSTKVGRILRPRSANRIVATDKYFIDPVPFYCEFDYSYDGIMRSFEDSLNRLSRNTIDLLLIHDLDPETHKKNYKIHLEIFLKSGYKALAKIKEEGLTSKIGIATGYWQACNPLLKEIEIDTLMLSGCYTLLNQSLNFQFLEIQTQKNIELIVCSIFNGGILVKKYGDTNQYNYKEVPNEVLQKLKKIHKISEEFNTSIGAIAINFVLLNPYIKKILIGANECSQIEDNINFLTQKISPEVWIALKDSGILQNDKCFY